MGRHDEEVLGTGVNHDTWAKLIQMIQITYGLNIISADIMIIYKQ